MLKLLKFEMGQLEGTEEMPCWSGIRWDGTVIWLSSRSDDVNRLLKPSVVRISTLSIIVFSKRVMLSVLVSKGQDVERD